MLENTFESPLDSQEIKPVIPKGKSTLTIHWNAEAEAPILWSPDEKNRLIRKDPNAGRNESRRRRG